MLSLTEVLANFQNILCANSIFSV